MAVTTVKNQSTAAASEDFSRVYSAIKGSSPYILYLVARLQSAEYLKYIEGLGVHPAETYVLLELWRQQPLSQTEISLRLDIGNATVGQTLKRLERDGFVQRTRCNNDKRRVLVKLTRKGWAIKDQISDAAVELNRTFDSVLGARDHKKLERLLSKIAAHYRQ